jgi:DNA-binding NarL/FixJ family response regulator
MIRVLLVDDDPTCREGLRQILSLAGDIEVVGEAASCEEAFAVGRDVRPQVVILDADLPRAACVDAILKLGNGEVRPDLHASVVCLAVYPDQHDAAIQAGAARFLRKDGSPRELVEAIRAAAIIPT